MSETKVIEEKPKSKNGVYLFENHNIALFCHEQYMMACKARLFNDKVVEIAIMKATDPRKIKALGRQVKGFDNDVWSARCQDIVYNGNKAKFSQNPKLLAQLLETGDRIIAEASSWDPIWGIGLSVDSPHVLDQSKWGKNLLGRALMQVREELRVKV